MENERSVRIEYVRDDWIYEGTVILLVGGIDRVRLDKDIFAALGMQLGQSGVLSWQPDGATEPEPEPEPPKGVVVEVRETKRGFLQLYRDGAHRFDAYMRGSFVAERYAAIGLPPEPGRYRVRVERLPEPEPEPPKEVVIGESRLTNGGADTTGLTSQVVRLSKKGESNAND